MREIERKEDRALGRSRRRDVTNLVERRSRGSSGAILLNFPFRSSRCAE
jgi:hypothetical protein